MRCHTDTQIQTPCITGIVKRLLIRAQGSKRVEHSICACLCWNNGNALDDNRRNINVNFKYSHELDFNPSYAYR